MWKKVRRRRLLKRIDNLDRAEEHLMKILRRDGVTVTDAHYINDAFEAERRKLYDAALRDS